MKNLLKKSVVLALAVVMVVSMFTMANAAEKLTVHVKNNAGWEAVSLYMWGDAEHAGSWPGVAMTAESDGWYTVTLDINGGITGFIFNNGNNGKQTGDLSGLKAGEFWFELSADGATATAVANPNGDATPKTGDVNAVLPVAVIGVVALTVAVVAKKKKVNA